MKPLQLSRYLGFRTSRATAYYALLSIPSFAFIMLMSRSTFVKSHYCSPAGENAPPGECYFYTQPSSRFYFAIQTHLLTCLPALGLAVSQFTPRIRSRYPGLHRWMGRASMLLALTATVSAVVLADIAFGGTWSTFTAVWFLGILSVLGHYKAYTAILAGEIHMHRRWILRTWAWLGSIISMRPIFALLALLLTVAKQVVPAAVPLTLKTMPVLCGRLVHTMIFTTYTRRINVLQQYPECVKSEYQGDLSTLTHLFHETLAAIDASNGTRVMPDALWTAIDTEKSVSISTGLGGKLDQTMAAIDLTFGMGLWVAVLLHAVLVETWLRYTAGENGRLRKVSLMRKKQSVEKIS